MNIFEQREQAFKNNVWGYCAREKWVASFTITGRCGERLRIELHNERGTPLFIDALRATLEPSDVELILDRLRPEFLRVEDEPREIGRP